MAYNECKQLPLPPLSAGVAEACFTLSEKVFVAMEVLIATANGLNKMLIVIFTSLGRILTSQAAFSALIFVICFLKPGL